MKKIIGWVIFVFGILGILYKVVVSFSDGLFGLKDVIEMIPWILPIVVGWILADIGEHKNQNKKISIIIAVTLVLVVGLIFVVGRKAPWSTPSPQYPKMTAPEVCQYVNQALHTEYIYERSTASGIFKNVRYERRFTALSAVYREKATYAGEVANDKLKSVIKALSPQALSIYREQLREQLKTMTPQEREPVLSRLRGISEVEDIVREYEPEGEGTWLVDVKVVVEAQRLENGQWVFATGITFGSNPYVMQYVFNEATGALAER